MFKAVKNPKEYAVIKVPSDCKDVGKFVHEEFENNGIQIKVITQYDPKVVTRVGENQNRVNPGDVIVDDYSFLNGHMLHVMSQKDFEKKFKPIDNNNKLGDMSSSVDIDTTTAQRTLQAINAKMSTAVSIEKQPHVRIEFDDINDVPHVMTLLGMKGLVMNDEARQALAVIVDQYLVIYSHLIDIGQSEPFAHQTATNIIQAQYAAYKE